jgi:hypothetical protein
LRDWLENLAGYFSERLLRIKGLVRMHEVARLVLIQGVGAHIDGPRTLAAVEGPSGLFIVVRDAGIDELAMAGPALPNARVKKLRQLRPAKLNLRFAQASKSGSGAAEGARDIRQRPTMQPMPTASLPRPTGSARTHVARVEAATVETP